MTDERQEAGTEGGTAKEEQAPPKMSALEQENALPPQGKLVAPQQGRPTEKVAKQVVKGTVCGVGTEGSDSGASTKLPLKRVGSIFDELGIFGMGAAKAVEKRPLKKTRASPGVALARQSSLDDDIMSQYSKGGLASASKAGSASGVKPFVAHADEVVEETMFGFPGEHPGVGTAHRELAMPGSIPGALHPRGPNPQMDGTPTGVKLLPHRPLVSANKPSENNHTTNEDHQNDLADAEVADEAGQEEEDEEEEDYCGSQATEGSQHSAGFITQEDAWGAFGVTFC